MAPEQEKGSSIMKDLLNQLEKELITRKLEIMREEARLTRQLRKIEELKEKGIPHAEIVNLVRQVK